MYLLDLASGRHQRPASLRLHCPQSLETAPSIPALPGRQRAAAVMGTAANGTAPGSRTPVGGSMFHRAARRHSMIRRVPWSYQTKPGAFGGSAARISASTQAREEPGNALAKLAGYRRSRSRFVPLAATTQTDATR